MAPLTALLTTMEGGGNALDPRAETAMAVSVRRLHPLFAAEIDGVDLGKPLDQATVADLVAALDRYAVLVVPKQFIGDEEQLAFGRYFGPLETATFSALKDRDRKRRHGEINYVSNLDPDGRLLPADNRVRMYQIANRLWHTDSSFKPIAGRYSLLHARVVPAEGGETEFADLRAAYDALPGAMRAKIAGLVAEHSLLHSNRQLGLPDFSAEEQAAMPPEPRPLVHTLTASGRTTLYLASHASHIVGWPVPEGRVLLNDLMEHATQREFVYQHRWAAGDLLIWDNRCTMHRVRAYDEKAQRRELRRVMVQDTSDTLNGRRLLRASAS
ncbi:MAG TPA: TauD/TfdA family dioxygenase [Stellaceae bacterium]|nr:TauD/TfdA family dioxygenase [Stellaceae bacterium]